jgi:flagellar biosynthesis/type III secretory pathway protein FliH
VLSDNRLSLEPARSERVEAPRASRPLAIDIARAPEPLVVERIVPAPIDFDIVVDWLREDGARPRLVEHLADDLSALRAAARAEGLAAGKAEGLAIAQAQASRTIELLEILLARAEVTLHAETEELAAMCAEVVCAALAKIAGPVLNMREAALGTVMEVLKRVKDERELTIRVSAHDLPALREHSDDIERACAGRRFSLVADARVEAGGCIVESALGSLDGRFDVQLRALSETLRAAKATPPEPL